jgi:hypothetical protein
MGMASFVTPAGTLKVFEFVGEVWRVTVPGAEVIANAQTLSWKRLKFVGGPRLSADAFARAAWGLDQMTSLSSVISGKVPFLKASA